MRWFFTLLAWLIVLSIAGVAGTRIAAPCAPALNLLDPLATLGLPTAASACAAARAAQAPPAGPLPPVVTVAIVAPQEFADSVFVSGTLAARNEVMAGAQIDGLRLTEILAEDGDHVAKNQVLARLDGAQLDALLAQSDAALLRADAAIAQAASQIGQYEASVGQTAADLERAEKLGPGVLAQSSVDQRQAAARSAKSQLAAARDALMAARADKVSRQAERRELQVRIERTFVRAPVAGVVSRRAARLGAVAMGAGEPLFRIIEDGAIDLEADAPQQFIGRLQPGQEARVRLPGLDGETPARVRLVSQEIDKNSRTGKVRIALAQEARARIGGFASATIVIERRSGLSAPASAVLRTGDRSYVEAIENGRVALRAVAPGVTQGDRIELRDGVTAGETLVARAAAFLRAGDLVRPIHPPAGAGDPAP